MPQITQLPLIFFSQLFWLLVVFAIIFFGIGRGMLPKIQGTVESREKKIADVKRDRNKWRVFTEADIQRIKKVAANE